MKHPEKVRKLQIDERRRCSFMNFYVYLRALKGSEKVAKQPDEEAIAQKPRTQDASEETNMAEDKVAAERGHRRPLRRKRWHRKNAEQEEEETETAAKKTKAEDKEATAKKNKAEDGEIAQILKKGGEAAANKKAGMTDEGSG